MMVEKRMLGIRSCIWERYCEDAESRDGDMNIVTVRRCGCERRYGKKRCRDTALSI